MTDVMDAGAETYFTHSWNTERAEYFDREAKMMDIGSAEDIRGNLEAQAKITELILTHPDKHFTRQWRGAGESRYAAYFDKEADVPGLYNVTQDEVRIDEDLEVDSTQVGVVRLGAQVEVLEVRPLVEQHRIRARLRTPDGWISLVDSDTGTRSARKVPSRTGAPVPGPQHAVLGDYAMPLPPPTGFTGFQAPEAELQEQTPALPASAGNALASASNAPSPTLLEAAAKPEPQALSVDPSAEATSHPASKEVGTSSPLPSFASGPDTDPVGHVRQELQPIHTGPLRDGVRYMTKDQPVNVYSAPDSREPFRKLQAETLVTVIGAPMRLGAPGEVSDRLPIDPEGWVDSSCLDPVSGTRTLDAFEHLKIVGEGDVKALGEKDSRLTALLKDDPGVENGDAAFQDALRLYRAALGAFDPEPEIRKLLFRAACNDDDATLGELLQMSGLPWDIRNAAGETLLDVARGRCRARAVKVLEQFRDGALSAKLAVEASVSESAPDAEASPDRSSE